MHWVLVGVGVIVLGAGVLFGVNQVGGATLQSAPAQQQTDPPVDLDELRGGQRFSNTLFEIVPGEVRGPGEAQTTSAGPGGARYDALFRLRNLSLDTTLKMAFLELSATAYDEHGNEVMGWVYERHDTTSGIPPQKSWEIYSTVIVDPSAETWVMTVRYAEPGLTESVSNFAWPYGN